MKKILTFLVLAAAVWSACAQGFTVTRFSYDGPYPVRRPVIIDSVDVNGAKFTDASLLDGAFMPRDIMANGREFNADEDERLQLPTGRGSEALHYLGFTINNNGYTTGTLKVQMPENARLYMDGKQQKPAGGSLKLTLQPQTYEFVVKYLAAGDSVGMFSAVFEGDDAANLSHDFGTKRRYSIYDVMQGVRIRSASISPDAKYVIVNYAENPGGGQRSRPYSELLERQTGKVLQSLDATRGYGWMPRTEKMYYIRSVMGVRELVTVDPATMNEEVIRRGLPEGNLMVAPTEDYVIYMKKEQGKAEKDKSVRQVLDPVDRQAGARDRWSICRYDLRTGMDERLTFGHTTARISDVSWDGNSIIFSTSDNFVPERPFRRSSYYILDMQTMTVDTIFKDVKFINSITFSPTGGQLLVTGPAEAFGGIGLDIAPGQVSNMYDVQMFICKRDGSGVKAMTKNFDPSVDRAVWNAQDNMIYFSAQDRDYKAMFRMNPSNGKIDRLSTGVDVVSSFSMATTLPVMIYYGQSLTRSHQLYTLNMNNGTTTLLSDPSATTLKDIQLGEVKDWNFKSSDGTTIQGRVTLPPDFDPSKKYPMIVYYYGGTTPTSRTLEGNYPAQVYAGLGFVVYTVQPSGAIGFGQKFSARHVNAWGKRTADDIIEGTMKFCDAHPFVDRAKIGCIGASYGGFMTMYLQTVTDIFAAAISHAGISDITSYWGEGYWGYSYNAAAAANSYPWSNPELFVKQSPLFNADKVNTPLLLLHGTVDTNVPPGESIQMFTALKLLDKEVALVEVDGENHHIADPAKRVAWNNTIYAWFYKWLKDDPRWWDELYPKKDL